MGGEQPLTVVGARLVETEFDPGLDTERRYAGAHGRLQVEQRIELASLEGAPQVEITAPTLALVKGDHLDPGKSANRVASILPVIQVMRVWGQARWMTRTSASAWQQSPMAESRSMQIEEGGVWNSGMMWRNGGKMDGWHYANSPVDCKIARNWQPVPVLLLTRCTVRAGKPPYRKSNHCDY